MPAGPTVPFANSDGLFAVHVPHVVDHVVMLSASADVLSSVRAATDVAGDGGHDPSILSPSLPSPGSSSSFDPSLGFTPVITPSRDRLHLQR